MREAKKTRGCGQTRYAGDGRESEARVKMWRRLRAWR